MSIRVGVIGTGTIGSDHVTRLATQVVGSSVSAVFDVAADRAREIGAAVGARALESWELLITDPEVDAVLIASPGHLHPEQVLACLAAGKPVLCEKPLGSTTADCLKVLEAEAALGRRLVQVGFMRRYDHGYLDVKRAMDGGVIGEPLMAHAMHRNPNVPDFFIGEMSMTDSVVHEFDTFRWLFDTEIASVTVIAVRQSPLGADHLRDPQLVIVQLAGGQVISIESFVNCQYGYDVRCEIVGSLGTVTLDNPRTAIVIGAGRRSEAVPTSWRDRFGQAYVDELQAWINALGRGAIVGPSSWDGYAATAVAEAAVASFALGSRVDVTLVPRPALYS